MTSFRTALILAAGLALAGCAGTDVATRAATPDGPLLGEQGAAPMALARDYHVVAVDVTVPDTLVVSEANSWKPKADIVWHGDPLGNRYDQVDAVITAGLKAGVAGMDGKRDVKLLVEVTRFHALTQKTRYAAPPGWAELATHDVQMMLTVVDAKTGEVIEPAHHVGIDIKALTGLKAMEADARGFSQKDEIDQALEEMIRNALS